MQANVLQSPRSSGTGPGNRLGRSGGHKTKVPADRDTCSKDLETTMEGLLSVLSKPVCMLAETGRGLMGPPPWAKVLTQGLPGKLFQSYEKLE
ncbi:Hypothetical predicted protein [Pelobates cultripes]|uniref:Uncharacterized protein n=1 Tax=Pelobates cultripes TaxID=61616 RepID=A0AAD1W647_PELCU|nr:Hypothetical predicted protein [Pelobates cultripes]